MTRTVAAADLGMPTPHHDALGCSRALAAVVAAASRPAPVAEPDAELLALGAEMNRMEGIVRALATINGATAVGSEEGRKSDAAFLAAYDAQHEVMKKIADIPATTFAGLGVQGRALAYVLRNEYEDDIVPGSTITTDCRLVRALLAGSAQDRPAASPVTLPKTSTEHPDAELIDYGQRWIAVWQDSVRLYEDRKKMPSPESVDDMNTEEWREWSQRSEEISDRIDWLRDAILAHRAHTFEGLLVKAYVLAQVEDEECDGADLASWVKERQAQPYLMDRALASLIGDLLRLAAEPAR